MAPDRLFHADMYLEVYCHSIIDPSTVVLRIQGPRTLDQLEHQVPSNFGVCILRARTYDELIYDVIIARRCNIIVNVGELELARSSFVLRNGNVCSVLIITRLCGLRTVAMTKRVKRFKSSGRKLC